MNLLDREISGEEFLGGTSFLVSLAGHLLLVLLLFLKLNPSMGEFSAPVVYSVTLEGGKVLGGRGQVAEKENTPLAPPKNVSAPETKKEVEKKVEPKVEPKKEKVEDAEISLAKKKEKEKEKEKLQAKEEKKDSKSVQKQVSDPDKDYQKAMQRYLGESAEAGGKGFGAAALGGNGMGGGVIRSAEFIAYYNLLRAHIKQGWRWYDTSSHLNAVAYFRIERDGTVKDIKLTRGSGSREFDESVLRALWKANPVPAPPEKEYQNFKELKMTFDPRE